MCQPGLLVQESRRVEGETQPACDHLDIEAGTSQPNLVLTHKRPADTTSQFHEDRLLHLDKKIKVELLEV